MTLKLLRLGYNTRDYYWTLHPLVFLIQFVMKEFGIFTSVLSEGQTFWIASYYDLGLVFGTMTGYYIQVVFFFQFIAKKRHIRILAKDEYL